MDSLSTWQAVIALNLVANLIAGMVAFGLQKGVPMVQQATRQTKQGYNGYCWTYLFLGGLVPMVRGETGRGFLHLLFTVATLGMFQAVMPYFYNKQQMQRLEAAGWVQQTESTSSIAPVNGKKHADNSPEQAAHCEAEYFLGQIQLFASSIVPRGWMPCDGKVLHVRDHAALFALIGTNYGGDGMADFALPNLTNKEPVPGSFYCICTSGVFPSR